MESPATMKQRLPSGKACIGCRKRKNRCDGTRPQCSTCQTRGIPCDYPITAMDTLTVEELRALMKAKLRESVETPDSDVRVASPGVLRRHQVPPAAAVADDQEPSGLGALLRASTDILGPPTRDDTASSTTAADTAVVGDSPNIASMSSNIRDGTSPTSSPAESQEPDGFFGESSTFAFVSKVQSTSMNDMALHRLSKRRRLSSVRSAQTASLDVGLTPKDPGECYELPPKQLADCLLDAYFARVHRLYPFVHEPTFRLEYERMWVHHPRALADARPLWFGLLNMVFAHGVEFCDAILENEPTSMATCFVNNARRIVFAHIFKEGSLELVQALLLMCHYLQSTLELNECWSLVGLMIRTSVSLGLHFNPPESEALTSVEREVRKRIWWGCYVIDRTLSMKFGRPPSIQGTHAFDIDLPLDVDDQYIGQDSVVPRQPEGRPSLTIFFTRTIKLAKIVDKVLVELYQPNQRTRTGDKPPNQDAINSYIIGHSVLLDGELLSWWDEMPPHLKIRPEVPDGPDFELQRNVLFIRFGYLRLLIHRQSFLIFSKYDIDDPFQRAVTIASCRSCVNAARETIKVVHTQYRRRLLNSLWYILHYVFTSMGVLLSLQTMEKSKLEALGETYHDETLELGMEFLRVASRVSTLAAGYVAMLQRIRTTRPTNATATPAEGHPEGPLHQSSMDGLVASPLLASQEEGNWFQRSQDEFQMFGDSGLVDFNDLLFGTGLPRDLLSSDWTTFGSLLS